MSWSPLRFDAPVRPGGYAWWYVDAVSDDGAHGLTIIMFVGSVFSSRYAQARRRGDAEAERFCAVNVALYDLQGGRHVWAMNEHASFARDAEHLRVGNSTIRWRDGSLELVLDEVQTRFFGRAGAPLRGRVHLRPTAVFGPCVELDRWQDPPRHRWYPVAPHARIEVELEQPQLSFAGSGYHDVNEGDEGLEHGFSSWNWSRCDVGDATLIAYDVIDPTGCEHARAWRFDPAARTVEDLPSTALGPACGLPRSRWGVARSIRCDPGHTPTLRRTLEDTPFYSRNLIDVHALGREAVAVHESISLHRFARAWVRFLLRFKTSSDASRPALLTWP